MFAHDIIIRPIITEKTMGGMPVKKYTFQVAKDAEKIQIARAVEEIFGVEVESVNTSNRKGKLRRRGRSQGYTASWKKAVVTLKKESKAIEFFESLQA